jgi:SNF2 family DNA or RNA helicase
MPNKFNNLELFEKQYNNLSEQEQINKLHSKLAPHILRREKIDVEKSLPIKNERILTVEKTFIQKKYYKWILTKNFKELNKNGNLIFN